MKIFGIVFTFFSILSILLGIIAALLIPHEYLKIDVESEDFYRCVFWSVLTVTDYTESVIKRKIADDVRR